MVTGLMRSLQSPFTLKSLMSGGWETFALCAVRYSVSWRSPHLWSKASNALAPLTMTLIVLGPGGIERSSPFVIFSGGVRAKGLMSLRLWRDPWRVRMLIQPSHSGCSGRVPRRRPFSMRPAASPRKTPAIASFSWPVRTRQQTRRRTTKPGQPRLCARRCFAPSWIFFSSASVVSIWSRLASSASISAAVLSMTNSSWRMRPSPSWP